MHVYLVVVPESIDGVYVFGDAADRDRFFDAYTAENGEASAFTTDEGVIGADGTRALVRAVTDEEA